MLMRHHHAGESARVAAAGVWRAMPSVLATAALVAFTTSAFGAGPSGWKGDSLGWQYYAYGGPYNGDGSPGQCTVGKKNTCGTFTGYFNIITSPKSITFNYSPSGSGGTWSQSELSLPPTIYNGIAINLVSRGTITSVTIDKATNMAGFNASHLSFTANQIQVDWQNLSYNSSTIVKLDVKTAKKEPLHGPTLMDNPPRQ